MEKVLFTEEQRYTQWWLWLLLSAALLSVVVPFGIGISQQLGHGQPWGNEPISDAGLLFSGIFSTAIMLGAILLVRLSRLKTKITTEGIYVSYYPLMRKWKMIAASDVERYELRSYRAKREYGGHGLRRRRRAGRAYTIAGNLGLQLYLKDGTKILIGTQRKQALEYAMRKLMEGEE